MVELDCSMHSAWRWTVLQGHLNDDEALFGASMSYQSATPSALMSSGDEMVESAIDQVR